MIFNDIRLGLKKNRMVTVVAFLLTLVFGILFFQKVSMHQDLELSEAPGIMDYLLYIFGGMKKYVESKENSFEVPVLWMSLQFVVALSVYVYPIQDLYSRGTFTLYKYQTRSRWWRSKCIWAVVQVVVIYAAFYLGLAAAMLFCGVGKEAFHQCIADTILGIPIQYTSSIFWLCILFPLLNSLLNVLVQMNLSLMTGPMISMLVILAYQIASAYVMSPFLLGNYSMLFRLSGVVSDGLSGLPGAAAQLVVMVVSCVAGLIYFKRYDVLERS